MELEDEIEDVLAKAAKGHGWDAPDPDDLEDGEHVANELGLDYEALCALEEYEPEVDLPAGIRSIVTDFGHIGVNSWLLEKDGTRVLFDMGTDGEVIAQEIGSAPLDAIFLTHNHVDHVGGYDALRPRAEAFYAAGDAGFPADWAGPSDTAVGALSFRLLDVTGHSTPSGAPDGLAFFTTDFGVPVCVVGDALFAGSMGGCMTPERYEMALAALTRLDSLPAETIFLPGHGPATTLDQERDHNPFLAGLK